MSMYIKSATNESNNDICSIESFLCRMKQNKKRRYLTNEWVRRWYRLEGRKLRWYRSRYRKSSCSGSIDLASVLNITAFNEHISNIHNTYNKIDSYKHTHNNCLFVIRYLDTNINTTTMKGKLGLR